MFTHLVDPPTENSIPETTSPKSTKRQTIDDSHSHYLVDEDGVGSVGDVGGVDIVAADIAAAADIVVVDGDVLIAAMVDADAIENVFSAMMILVNDIGLDQGLDQQQRQRQGY